MDRPIWVLNSTIRALILASSWRYINHFRTYLLIVYISVYPVLIRR